MSIVGDRFDSSECNNCEVREACVAGNLLDEVVVEPLITHKEKLRDDSGPINDVLLRATVGDISPTELRGHFAELADEFAKDFEVRTEVTESILRGAVNALYDLDGNFQPQSPDALDEMGRVVADNESLLFTSSITPEGLLEAAVDVNNYALSGQCGALEVTPTVPGPLVNIDPLRFTS